MSGVVPKRSHEEGVVTPHPSSSSPKSTHPPVTPPPPQAHQQNQLHSIPHPPLASPPAYEAESRTVKGPRSEPRDGERRSPLQFVYRSPSLPPSVSSGDPHLTHTSMPLEPRDGTKDVRAESRDNRSEGREREIQGPKGGERSSADDFSGKDNTGSYIRNDGGRDVYGEAKRKEIQGPKSDRDAKSDHKAESTKMGKEHKDYHRGKSAEGSTEVGVKDSSAPVEGPHLEGRGESAGENKVEDRFKEQDKTRKDLKHREWGDRDKDRSERRGSMLVGGGSVMSETKEVGREERETSRWERERMEQNDRERSKEKGKDHIKREPQKEVSQKEKELGEASAKPAEQEYVAPEQEDMEKDEKESKDKRRERDGDSEAERAEKRSRISEKESEDGCLDSEGGVEREKDAFSYGVQQRKRMLRPRGSSPQTANRDRVRSRSQDNEGVQGNHSILIFEKGLSCTAWRTLVKNFG